MYTENDPKIKGFEIYRTSEKYYNTYQKIASCPSSARSFIDSTAMPGVAYFYYMVSVGDSADNNGVGMTPPGRLTSGRYYTQTYDAISTPMSVDDETGFPTEYYLSQNFPNPFNPSTTIQYQLPHAGFVSLTVYDVLGKEVATLVNEEKSAGRYSVQFTTNRVSSGVYFYRLRAGEYHSIKRMVVLK